MISFPRPRPSPPHHPHHHPPHHCGDQLPSASMPGALTSARVALPSLQKALFPNVQCSQCTMHIAQCTMYNEMVSPLYKKHCFPMYTMYNAQCTMGWSPSVQKGLFPNVHYVHNVHYVQWVDIPSVQKASSDPIPSFTLSN